MNTENFEKTFWNYYLELENNYLEIERMIPFDEVNHYTFSYRYMDLLGSICSEIDVLFKMYIEIKQYTTDLDQNGKPMYNIDQYLKFIESQVPNFKSQEITCYNPRFYNEKVFPFDSWSISNPPKWWTIGNKLKHDKEKEIDGKKAYKYANQIFVLNALSALFQLNLYIYKELKKDDDELKVPLYESQLFQLENWGDYYRHIINGRDASKPVVDFAHDLANQIRNG